MNLRDGRKGCPERGGVGDLSVSKYFSFLPCFLGVFLKGFGWGGRGWGREGKRGKAYEVWIGFIVDAAFAWGETDFEREGPVPDDFLEDGGGGCHSCCVCVCVWREGARECG